MPVVKSQIRCFYFSSLFIVGKGKSLRIMANEKKEKDVTLSREWAKLWLGIVLAAFGMGIVVFSLIVPPVGAIHATVVTTFGTILTFVGALFGIDSNAKIKMHEQDIDFEIRKREIDEKMKRLDRKFGMEEDRED